MEPGEQIGDYRVIKLIGVGGQAEVVLAECTRQDHPRIPNGTHVALKKFYYQAQSEKSIAHFMERARHLETFNHPNVVRYLDHFQWGDKRPENCIVMEYIDGDTVPEWLLKSNSPDQIDDEDEDRPLPRMDWENASACIEHVIEGLIYARDRGFTHRDLKPDNIMIVAGGENVKVLDFDIARLVEDKRTHQTRSGNRAPLPYMAPEYHGDALFLGDQLSDIYGLGVTLYELLCGGLFWDQNDEAVQYLVLNHPALDDFVLPGINALMQKATARPRHKRYQTFETLRDDMRTITRRVIKGQQTYRLIRFIKQGGYGAVYAGEAIHNETPVAIKRLLPPDRTSLQDYERNRRKFRREAKLLCENKHPNIVGHIEYIEGNDQSDPFLVMEYLPGMPDLSLAGQVAMHGTLSPEYAAILFVGYAEALHFLHDGTGKKRIIHRDISPDNLYAPADPKNARLLDLGVARDQKATRTFGGLATKWQYAAPEFTENRGTPQTDIYSLGLCLYEALTGSKGHPPTGNEFQSFIKRKHKPMNFRVDTVHAAKLQDYPKLRDIIDKACHPIANARYLSAARMRSDLMDAIAIMRGRTQMTTGAEPNTKPLYAHGSACYPHDQDANKTTPHATDDRTKAAEEADAEDWRERLRRIKDGGLKAAAILIMTITMAAGWVLGPTLWHTSRMQAAMRSIEYPLQADLATAERLIRLHQTCLKHAPETRLFQPRWNTWQQDLQASIMRLPQLFEDALNHNHRDAARMLELADAWRKTENIWREDQFMRHQSDWRQIMGRLELARFALAPETDNPTIPGIQERKGVLDKIIHDYFAGNSENANDEIIRAWACLSKQAMRLVEDLKTRAATIERDPAQTDHTIIEALQGKLNELGRLVPHLNVADARGDLERIRKIVEGRGYDNQAQIANHKHAVQALNDARDRLSSSATVATLGSAVNTLDLYYLRFLRDNDERRNETHDVLNSFKGIVLAGVRQLIKNTSPVQRLTNLADIDTHFARFEQFFSEEDDVRQVRAELKFLRSAFAFRIENMSDIPADLIVQHLRDNASVPAMASSSFLLTNVTAGPITAILQPRGEWAGKYSAASFPLVLNPGGGTSNIPIRASDFPTKPVTVHIDIPKGMTPPICAGHYVIGSGKRIPVPQGGRIVVTPPATITVNFTREDHKDESIRRDVQIGSDLEIAAPLVWSRTTSDFDRRFELFRNAFEPIKSRADAAIHDDLTWAYQISGIRQDSSVRSPTATFRRSEGSHPPDTRQAWQRIGEELVPLRQTLSELRSLVVKGHAGDGRFTTIQHELEYISLWAQQRQNDPTNAQLLDALSSFNHLPDAAFAHAVLSGNYARASEIRGFRQYRHYIVHYEMARRKMTGTETPFRDPNGGLKNLYDVAELNPELLNTYDLRLAFALTMLIWDDAANRPLSQILRRASDTGVPPVWKIQERDPVRTSIRDSSASLRYIIQRSSAESRDHFIRDFNAVREGRETIIPRRMAIMLHATLTQPEGAAYYDAAIVTTSERSHEVFIRTMQEHAILDSDVAAYFRGILGAQ
jgi:serine/threonine protein kinase